MMAFDAELDCFESTDASIRRVLLDLLFGADCCLLWLFLPYNTGYIIFIMADAYRPRAT